ITHDLMEGRAAAGAATIYEAADVRLEDFAGDKPRVRYRKAGHESEIACDFIAGCDGFHGVARKSVPAEAIRQFERVYPFGWLGGGALRAHPPALPTPPPGPPRRAAAPPPGAAPRGGGGPGPRGASGGR